MFTPRNVVLTVIAIFVISVAWACYTVTRPPDSGGLGGDTYGVRQHGLRGLFEVLEELDVPVERGLTPPTDRTGDNVTIVLWKPVRGFVAREPEYLHSLADWMESGGHIVAAPPDVRHEFEILDVSMYGTKVESLLAALRIPELDTAELNLRESRSAARDTVEDTTKKPSSNNSQTRKRRRSFEEELELARKVAMRQAEPLATRTIRVQCLGSLAWLGNTVQNIEVPEERLQVLDLGSTKPQGQITFVDPEGKTRVLAAAFSMGKGNLVVVGAPTIGENQLIAKQDNSVLIAELLAGTGRRVVFDEFYHGLTVRGNPMWLFTRPGFSVVTLCLLLLAGMVIWRDAIFLGPPLADAFTQRRSIGEYVVAMARFLNRGAMSRQFVLEEVRNGVLHTVRRELSLPPGREDPQDLAAVLKRRQPERAKKLVDAVRQIDQALSAGNMVPEKEAIRLLQGISSCL